MRRFLAQLVIVLLLVCGFSLVSQAQDIKVAPQGRYFQRGGKAFLIIGPNDALTWPGLSPALGGGSPQAAEEYLAKLAAHGVNTLRVMLEYAQFPQGLLENPIGTFRPEVVEFWDQFFGWLEKYDMYAIVTPWDPFWMERTWDTNPYNVENGGFMASMHGFLTNDEPIAAQKNRFRYAIERWGGSKRILAWELMNEIELWWGASTYEIEDWLTMMAQFVRAEQHKYHGFSPLITVSSAAATPSDRLAEVILNHPELDFATTHLYTGPGMNAPENTTDVAEEVGLAVNYALWMIKDRRPYTDTESGPIEQWIGSPDFDAEFLHNVSWAHLASGGAGTGMRWPYRHPHILSDQMLQVLSKIARFIQEFDFTGFSPDPITGDIVPPEGYYAYGLADSQRALVWTLRPANAQSEAKSATIFLEYLEPGAYQVRFWDPQEAEWVASEVRDFADGSGPIATPPFVKDIAIVLERLE